LETASKPDIAGACRLELDALFIAGGIHAAELRENPEAIAALFRDAGVRARAMMAALTW
jgi:hypothetical protein